MGYVLGRTLWEELGKPQGEYCKWVKRKLKTYLDESDYITFYECCGSLNSGNSKKIESHKLTINGVLKMCMINSTNTFLSKKVLKKYNVEGELKPPRLEIKFIDKLEAVLEGMGCTLGKRQYNVGRYRIDYYLEQYSLAIEYDEDNHSGYSKMLEDERQSFIEEFINCRFIRVNDSLSDEVNIGKIIKEIINETIHKGNSKLKNDYIVKL